MQFSKLNFQSCSNVFKKKAPFVVNSATIIFSSRSSSAKGKNKKPQSRYFKTMLKKMQNNFSHDKTETHRIQSTKNKKITIISSLVWLTGYLIYNLGAAETDQHGFPIKDDLSQKPIFFQYLIRSYRELKYYGRLIKEPSKEKLLPDPLPIPYIQPRYTLVLELTDVLVHPEWTYQTGWRYKKRPLLDYFLKSLQHDYEIVIYTGEQGVVAYPLIEAIDANKVIAHKLVRDATHLSGGTFIKTLDRLNRDLSKVICIDWNPRNVKFHPENLLNIKRWIGDEKDKSLIDLVSFLKTIAANNVEDVREVLKCYSKFDDPVEAYREKQRRRIEELDEAATANHN